jgi:hypothetical protein
MSDREKPEAKLPPRARGRLTGAQRGRLQPVEVIIRRRPPHVEGGVVGDQFGVPEFERKIRA